MSGSKRRKDSAEDLFGPTRLLLVKLGSIAVHADELTSPGGHPLDADAIRSLLADPEVAEWITRMSRSGLLPVQRSKRGG